jgi:ATP-dependent DNA ligase
MPLVCRRCPGSSQSGHLPHPVDGLTEGQPLPLSERLEQPGDVVFQHACRMGLEGIVSKRLGSRYRSGRSPDWLKFKNPEAPAVKREAEVDWGR